jgi:hypothetical protein
MLVASFSGFLEPWTSFEQVIVTPSAQGVLFGTPKDRDLVLR